MTIRIRTAFFIGLAVFVVWFLYFERAILAPFILGAIFAYLFNPVINFFSNRVKLPRTISIIIIYLVIIALLVFLSQFLARQIISESSEFKNFIDKFSKTAKESISNLPIWIKPAIEDSISSFEKLKITPFSIFNFFPAAISKIVSFIIFLFSAFYFLKEGKDMFNRLLNFVPKSYRIDIEILFRKKINNVLGAYLRGQMILIVLVALLIYITLSILGVKFALILGIFSGIVEIIPIIGPIIAMIVSAIVALSVGNLNFSLTPISGAVTVVIVLFVIRQFQDYFINPFVLRKVTKLHPLIILFSVLSGEHIWGILGIMLAVPTAATIKILLGFCFEKISKQSLQK